MHTRRPIIYPNLINNPSVTFVHTLFFAHQVILWDKIVESAEEAHLLERDMTVKYGLIDEVRNM